MPPPRPRIGFGDFAFDPATGELWRDGRRVPLQRQPSRLLALLLANPGTLVGREEIRVALWGGGTHVDFERSLNFCVAKVRSALRDNAGEPIYIETVPTRGYRFIATITTIETPSAPEAPRARAAARPDVRTIAAVVLVLMATMAVVFLRGLVNTRMLVPKVVVVPFRNDTGSAALDLAARGISDATVARLADSKRLLVIGNASNLTFSFRPPDMKAMGESLDAQYLVLGQVKKDARLMRVVAHLIRVSDQTHVWATTYDSETLDLPQQASIANAVAAAVEARIGKR
jgi:TolB-like protein/DNA-binding winged helix-turn-helix (wHTH) protein